jgi:hypothetical protein
VNSSLETRLAEELHARAADTLDVPDLGNRVIARGHALRGRRRRAAALAAGTSAVLLVLVGLHGPGRGADATPAHQSPPSPPSSTPSPSSTPGRGSWFDARPEGPGPRLDLISGTRAVFAGHEVELPAGWEPLRFARYTGGWLVEAVHGNGRVVATVTADGAVRVLDDHDPGGISVDPTGSRAAWGSVRQDGSRDRLVVVDLPTGKVLARRTVPQPVRADGWVPGGVTFSYAVDPGGSPYIWDLASNQVRSVVPHADARPTPTFVAMRSGRNGWLLYDWQNGCSTFVTRAGDRDPGWRDCEQPLLQPAAFAPGGDLVAAISSVAPRTRVRVVDRHGKERQRFELPGENGVDQMAWEDDDSLLLTLRVADASVVLRCAVTSGDCERTRLPADPGAAGVLLAGT